MTQNESHEDQFEGTFFVTAEPAPPRYRSDLTLMQLREQQLLDATTQP